jgi:hypothetical protein
MGALMKDLKGKADGTVVKESRKRMSMKRKAMKGKLK